MKTAKLTRYRLRWKLDSDGFCWVLLFGGTARVAAVLELEPGTFTAVLWPKERSYRDPVPECPYEGPSLPQAKREASKAIRLFMCREVDGQDLLGKRVKKGRIRR